jgi:hypothetical protein
MCSPLLILLPRCQYLVLLLLCRKNASKRCCAAAFAAAGCVPTISDTATALSVPRAAVAKTMALLVDHEPLLVVTRGDQRVDMHKARSSVADSDSSTSRTLDTRICSVVAAADAAAISQHANSFGVGVCCAAPSVFAGIHSAASCSTNAAVSCGNRMLAAEHLGTRRQPRVVASLGRYTPPVAAAVAARRLRLLRLV